MISKSTLFIYFYTYFSSNMIFVYTRTYLPIYFSDVMRINISQLSFILFFSYLALLLRPLVSIYFDRNNSKRKFFVNISGLAILISFSFLVPARPGKDQLISTSGTSALLFHCFHFRFRFFHDSVQGGFCLIA